MEPRVHLQTDLPGVVIGSWGVREVTGFLTLFDLNQGQSERMCVGY